MYTLEYDDDGAVVAHCSDGIYFCRIFKDEQELTEVHGYSPEEAIENAMEEIEFLESKFGGRTVDGDYEDDFSN